MRSGRLQVGGQSLELCLALIELVTAPSQFGFALRREGLSRFLRSDHVLEISDLALDFGLAFGNCREHLLRLAFSGLEFELDGLKGRCHV